MPRVPTPPPPRPPPPPPAAPLTLPADAVVTLRGADGRRTTTFPRPDGSFQFSDVPAGVHYVDVDAVGLLFPSVRPQPDVALG